MVWQRGERGEEGAREGGGDEAEVRARSEDGRERESRGERGESQGGGGCSFVFKSSQ